MNWDAIGALGEVVGAAAVVVSILYLSHSLRHGSATERRRANHELLESTTITFVALAENPVLAEIWGRGLVAFGSLAPAERVQFSSLTLNVVYTWEEAFHASAGGQLDAFAFERTTGPRSEIINLPGFQEWWRLRRSWFGAEFRDFLEAEMTAPAVTPMYERGPAAPDGPES